MPHTHLTATYRLLAKKIQPPFKPSVVCIKSQPLGSHS